MSFIKLTEQNSLYRNLESKTALEILQLMNAEDHKVADAVQSVLPVISKLVEHAIEKLQEGGRLFYIGAGTSGRLGILDASECPPTFGVPPDLVNGIIAGGDKAIRKAVEFAEDDTSQAWQDLLRYFVDDRDVVIGITASGTTPYVVNGLKECRSHNIMTACITANPDSPVSRFADYKIEVPVGPEFITGSSRLKSGTAQKMILNMISTAVMIGLGRIIDNKMVDMQLTNEKLIQRGIRMIQNVSGLSDQEARELLLNSGSARNALEKLGNQ